MIDKEISEYISNVDKDITVDRRLKRGLSTEEALNMKN